MAAPGSDIFDDSLVRPPTPGVARFGRPVETVARPRIERFRRIGATRVLTSTVIAGAGAVASGFPLWGFVLFPLALVALQCIRHPDGARWLSWSVWLAAYGAEATIPFTWGGRFVALLLFFTPFVSYLGSVLRGLPEP